MKSINFKISLSGGLLHMFGKVSNAFGEINQTVSPSSAQYKAHYKYYLTNKC